jgi:fluoride ion exporter CrcB/FEX
MGLGGFIDRRIPEHFPWDTMVVNVIGVLAIFAGLAIARAL